MNAYYNLWKHSESAKYMLWNVTTSEEEEQARMERTIVYEANHEYAWLVYEKQILNALTDFAKDRLGAQKFIASCSQKW